MLVRRKSILNSKISRKLYVFEFFNNLRKSLCFHKKNKIQKKLVYVSAVNKKYFSLKRGLFLFSLVFWKKNNFFFGIKRKLVAFFNLFVFKNLFKFFCVKRYFFFKYILFFKDVVNYLQFILFKYFNFSFIKGYFANLSYMYNMYFYYHMIQTFTAIKNKKRSFYQFFLKKFRRILSVKFNFRKNFNIFAFKKITFLRYCGLKQNLKKGFLCKTKIPLYFSSFVVSKNYLFQAKNIIFSLKKKVNNIIFLHTLRNPFLLEKASNLFLVYNLNLNKCVFCLQRKLCISFTLYMNNLLKSVNNFITKINMNFISYIRFNVTFIKYTYHFFFKNILFKPLLKKKYSNKVVKKVKKLTTVKKKLFFSFLSNKKHQKYWKFNFFFKKKIKFLRKNVQFSNKYYYRFLYIKYLQLFYKNFFVRFFMLIT